ncbi:MAG: NAD(P)H-dependent oxidoreductase [Pseudomonadota bacterium]
MSKLLYIESSPRKESSASTEVAQSFIDTFKQADASHEVETLNLWEMALPEFDGERIAAKYSLLHGQMPVDDEARGWEAITKITEQFKAADSYLFSIPMWNFSIPYKLKHFIDLITQPGLTFSFSPETGYQGMVTGKPVSVIYARGGDYSGAEVSAMDFQKTYMQMILGFIGFEEINSVVVEPTLADPESREKTITAAKELAVAFANQ